MLPSAAVPLDETWIARRLQSLEAEVRELRTSTANLGGLRDQVTFLAGQSVASVGVNTWSRTTVGNADVPWADGDPSLTVTTGATGALLVQTFAHMRTPSGSSAAGWVVVTAGGELAAVPTIYMTSAAQTSDGSVVIESSPSAGGILTLEPATEYVIRLQGSLRLLVDDWPGVTIDQQALLVTQLGM